MLLVSLTSVYCLPVAVGTRHSRRFLFILPFPKTHISISYEANGTRDFRHRCVAPLCNVVSGYRIYGPFFFRKSRSRLNDVSGSGIHSRAFVYVRLAPRKTPFLSLIVSTGLVEMVRNMMRKMLQKYCVKCANMYKVDRSKFI